MSDSPVITRFAPSPTGHLHIGGARTALFCWAFARRNGGRFVLRLEDTDRARSSEAYAESVLESLAWLGIDWDEGPELTWKGRELGGDPRGVGPFRQSERFATYDAAINDLIGRGLAYPAFETPEELDAKRQAAVAAGEQYRYDRAALNLPESEREKRMAAGDRHVIRFKAPEEAVVVEDAILGEVRFEAGELDDFILRKADGSPTYHFAVVVDDELMGVTHVLRGQEHLTNTPRHVALQQALGYRVPTYAHMPLIFNERGAKMSKRERDASARQACKDSALTEPPTHLVDEAIFSAWLGDKKMQLPPEQLDALADAMHLALPEVTVEDFRAAGYLPGVICNFIALLGWNPGNDVEKFDRSFLAEQFSLDRIGKANARFDRKKLLAFNTDAITSLSDDEFADLWHSWCKRYAPAFTEAIDYDAFAALAAAIRPQCKTFADAAGRGRFLLADDEAIAFDEKSVKKHLHKADGAGLEVLKGIRDVLAHVDPWDIPMLQEAVEHFAEERGGGLGKVAQPLRVALTGEAVSPPIAETLGVLGEGRVLKRIDRCLRVCGAAPA